MQRSKYWAPLATALALELTAAGLLSIAGTKMLPVGLDQVTMLIAGAVFFSGMSMLLDFPYRAARTSIIQINFNESKIRKQLSDVIDAEYQDVPSSSDPAWEPNAQYLATEDRILALAKVRIDLEREVRRIALEKDFVRSGERFSLVRTL